MQFNPKSHFVIVLPNEDANDTTVKLMLRGIAAGVPIRNPSKEDMDTLLMY